jgi:phage head maturation protease
MPDFTFDVEPDASFRVDVEKRTISGLAVPYGPVARSMGRNWRFTPGSLHWSAESRVKLNDDHVRSQSFGRAVRLQHLPHGLDASFKVGRGPIGDQALMDAEDGVKDGFSIEIDFEDGDSYRPDPDDPSVNIVDRATLRHVALTAAPAFDGARVASVVASREATTMTATAAEPTTAPAAPAAGPDFATFTAGVTEAIKTAIAEGFAKMPEPNGARPIVPAGSGIQVTYEPPVYNLRQGKDSPSFVKDAWKARTEGDQEAQERLRKFSAQQTSIAEKVNAAGLQFTTGTTGNLAEAIPPGYRPELYVPQLFKERPLTDSLSQGALSDATPFTVPRFVTATGMAANHVEGTNPTDGVLDLETVTVTPAAVSGLFKLTREIVDSSNPAVDAIALQAMREAYSQNVEAKVYTELNGANGVGGVITGTTVPSGATARTSTGTAAATSGRELLRALRSELAAYPFRRFASVNRIVLSQEGTTAFATATDTTERPLLPPLAPQNAAGTTDGLGTPVQGFNVDGLAARPAWSMTGNAAGDADLIAFNSADAWAWESPTLTFRYEERSGPALVELALFGYFATRILRPSGFTGIRHTVT